MGAGFGFLSLGTSLLGTGLSLWGNHEKNEAEKKSIAERNRVADLNLSFQKDAVKHNFTAGQEQIDQFQTQGEAALGTQKTLSASSGLGSGGSLDLVGKFSKNNLTSDINTMNKNNLQQYRMGMRQADLNYQGSKVSKPNQTGYWLGQGSTLLTGAANIINTSYRTDLIT